jgi:hypothetical protein
VGSYWFIVNGDNPRGAEAQYNVDGILVPYHIPRPIILRTLKAEFVTTATGNQRCGVMSHLLTLTSANGGAFVLKSGCTGPFEQALCWQGELYNDWGFGVGIFTDAGLGATHMMVLTASYELRDR